MILERPGNDLRGAGAASVDQDDDRVVGLLLTKRGLEELVRLRHSPPGGNYQRLGGRVADEAVGHLHRRTQQAARIEAEIDHETFQPTSTGPEILECLPELVAGMLLELGDPDQAVARFQNAGLDALDPDDVARKPEGQLPGGIAPQNGQRDPCPLFPAHPLDRSRDAHAVSRHPVNAPDMIIGLNAGPEGGGIVDGCDDRQAPLLQPQLNPDPAEGPRHLHLHLVERFRRQIRAMGIESSQHAVNHAFDKLLVIDLFHVAFRNGFIRLAEEVEVGLVGSTAPESPLGDDNDCQADDDRRRQDGQGGFQDRFFHRIHNLHEGLARARSVSIPTLFQGNFPR